MNYRCNAAATSGNVVIAKTAASIEDTTRQAIVAIAPAAAKDDAVAHRH